MISHLILSIFLAIGIANAVPACNNQRNVENDVLCGRNVTIEDYPYQVALYGNNQLICGGSIINENYVLTSALSLSNYNNLYIRAGSAITNYGGSLHQVIDIKVHDILGYNQQGLPVYDLALLKVYPPFVFDKTCQPASIYNADRVIGNGELVTITGYGYGYTQENQDQSYRLVASSVPVLSNDECNRVYVNQGYRPIGQEYFCVPCRNDIANSYYNNYGVPVYANGQLIGIYTAKKGCAQAGVPQMYSYIPYFTQWIQAQCYN